VSNPTGRPRGRPRKSVASPAARLRGRPQEPLANDPNRYALAIFEAHLRGADVHGISELRMAETLVGIAFGAVVQTPDNFERLACGQPYQVWMPPVKLPPWRLKQDPSERGENWRYGNAFRPWADDLRRKLRRLRKGQNDDANWLRAMSLAWYICLQGNGDKVEDARQLARSVGESEYFEKGMLSHLVRTHEQRQRQRAKRIE